MKQSYLDYQTCVHSRKRKSAPWKVYASCPNPERQPTYRGYQLPCPETCAGCQFYEEKR